MDPWDHHKLYSRVYYKLVFDRKQRKENEANAKILRELQQFNDANIRIGNNNEGKLSRNQMVQLLLNGKKNLLMLLALLIRSKEFLPKEKNQIRSRKNDSVKDADKTYVSLSW